MKNSYILAGFVALFLTSFFMASCLNDDNKIPPNCYDGLLNNNEEQIDCGGPCPLCDPCTNGIWNPELGETWLDCGGDCGECDPCFNGIQDGDEVGVDCGGTCGTACGELCDDGLPNGLEDGADPNGISPNPLLADCGGPYCEACPTCDDMLLNGDEIGIDCGGPMCDPCPTDGNCLNDLWDGDEAYFDCGGTICPPCLDTLSFKVNGQTKDCKINLSVSLSGGVFTIEGTTLANEQFELQMAEPVGVGWLMGVTVPVNATTIPDTYCNYVDATPTAYTSTVGNANLNVLILAVDDQPGGIIVGEFSGTMMTADEEMTTNIQQGFFMLNIPL